MTMDLNKFVYYVGLAVVIFAVYKIVQYVRRQL